MRVLFQGKLELLESGGGDRVQIENTARELSKLGVQVDIIPRFDVNYDHYDLVHIFQLDWISEHYFYSTAAKKHNKPLVLSPIHHITSELKRFEDEYQFDFRRVSAFLFKNQFHRDTFKNVYRSLLDSRKLYPTLVSVFIGLKKMHTKTLQLADAVLVQTETEAIDLENVFGVSLNWHKVSNGVAEHFINFKKDDHTNPLPFENYILCIGRLEPRKNQLSVIEAIEILREQTGHDFKLVIIGVNSPKKHPEYMYKFKKKIKNVDWITHIEKVDYVDIPSYYAYAKVCVSASWFETTGLTSLEALFCNTNAVASGAPAKEILGENVSYCDPGDVVSIKDAVYSQYLADRPNIKNLNLQTLTWEKAAKDTLKVYNSLV